MDPALLFFLILVVLLLALIFAFLTGFFPSHLVISPSAMILVSIFIIAGIIGFVLKHFNDNRK